MISGAHIDIDTWIQGEDLTRSIEAAVADGPFVLASVAAIGPRAHRCTFAAKRPGLALGYRNIIELQHRLSRSFDIVGAERVVTFDHLVRIAG